MGDLSYHFSRKEFECKGGECEFSTVDAELILVLESVRARFNVPVFITSGVRCPDYNKKVGGSPNSMHLQGKAADIVVKGVDPQEVYDYLDRSYPDRYGIGNYDDFTHVDVRGNKARF